MMFELFGEFYPFENACNLPANDNSPICTKIHFHEKAQRVLSYVRMGFLPVMIRILKNLLPFGNALEQNFKGIGHLFVKQNLSRHYGYLGLQCFHPIFFLSP